VKEIWRRLDAWLTDGAPAIAESLRPGATEAALAAAEAALGVRLPDDVRASLLIHDGQEDQEDALMADMTLLSLEAIVGTWRTLRAAVDRGGSRGAVSVTPRGAIRETWFSPRWIPLAKNEGGDAFCLDLDPGKKGLPGQIVLYLHEAPERDLAAASFREWLSTFVSGLESGEIGYDEEYGLVPIEEEGGGGIELTGDDDEDEDETGSFEVETLEGKDDVALVRLSGVIQAAFAPSQLSKIDELVAAGRRKILIDLREVKYLSSTGLARLVKLANGLKGEGGGVAFVNVPKNVRVVFEVLGIGRLFPICATRDEALAALGKKKR
jgi:anti-anti-sigma factor